jgi:hypothetical protein
MVKSWSSTELARNVGDLMENVVINGDIVLVTTYGRPRLVIARPDALRADLLKQLDLSKRRIQGKQKG